MQTALPAFECFALVLSSECHGRFTNYFLLNCLRSLYLGIKILFFNLHDVMKTLGGAKIQ